MTLSYQWLCDYLPQSLTPEEISEILTSVGLEVESLEKHEAVKGGLEGLIIGHVVACIPHPNADKLKLTKVDIGTGTPLSIVCGAPNVAIGQTVVVAPVGTTVYPLHSDPFLIKKAKIRGEESEGMICAEDEISLGESHDGIIVISEAVTPGTKAMDYYQLPAADFVYEIGLTPNRMDAMSHLGAVKDICAYLSNRQGATVVSKIPNVNYAVPEITSPIQVMIEDTSRCARYAGLCIDGITVHESPAWLKARLEAIGLRPINNVVDATNYVLHECGHPLHAFDRNAIQGNQIIVKTMVEGSLFITLDEKERTLSSSDLMICNAETPMCIAGVYGGLHSGVSEQTTSIFLESAWFLPDSIRKTSLRHGLRTDAATRFEKGADINNVLYALHRAAQLICEISGGQIVSSVVDQNPVPHQPVTFDISFDRIRQLAGKNYPAAQIKGILNSLCFTILKEQENGLHIQVPSSKPDITMTADIVEEIMRIDGLDQIPFSGKISYTLPETTHTHRPNIRNYIADTLTGKGLQELFTNSITNSAYYPDTEGLVCMMNNLSSELDCLRPTMLETGLVAIAYNLNRKNKQLAFFEFGKTYHVVDGVYKEHEKLCLYFSGHYHREHWKQKPDAIDIYYVKGMVETILFAMSPEFTDDNGKLGIYSRKKQIGFIEKVSTGKLKTHDIRQDVWFVELDWKMIATFYEQQKTSFKPIPKFPVVTRDLSMILNQQVTFQEVQKVVYQVKSKRLQTIDLFDVFESEKLGAGKKSYAINLSFYDQEKTLTDVDIEQEISSIMSSLESKLGASIRKS